MEARQTRVSDSDALSSLSPAAWSHGPGRDATDMAAAAAADAADAAHRHGVSMAPSKSLRPSPSLSHWQAQRPTNSARASGVTGGPPVPFTEFTFSFSER